MRGGTAGQAARGGLGALDGKLVAGSGISLSPTNGIGVVTIAVSGAIPAASLLPITLDTANSRVGVNHTAPERTVHVRYPAANNDPAIPALLVDANGGSQAVIAMRSTNGVTTFNNIIRGDSTGQVNLDAYGQVVIKTNNNSVYAAVYDTTGRTCALVGVYGSQDASGSLTLGSTTHATKGNVIVPSDRVIVGTSADMSGGIYTSGIQISSATAAAFAMGRSAAHASTTLATMGFFNGTTRVVAIDVSGGGATDSGTVSIYTKVASGSLVERIRFPAALPVAAETAMFLTYHNGTGVTIERVTIGAADSGGAGFKVLRVPN